MKSFPISFNMYNTLYETYNRIEMTDQYLVQTHLEMKATGISLLEVHSAWKTLVTSMPIERQKPQIQVKQVDQNRPELGRGKAGMWCKHPQLIAATLVPTNKLPKIPTIQKDAKDGMDFPVPEQLIMNKTETITRRQVQDKNREQPFYPDPFFRPPPRLPDNLQPESPKTNTATKSKIDIDFEGNSPHQEGLFLNYIKDPIKLILKKQKI